MEVGITMEIKNYNGSLALNVSQCGCYVKDLEISLDGGASWFYQGYALLLYLFGKNAEQDIQVQIVSERLRISLVV
jgi:lipopolysaccharide-binding protein